MHRTIVTTLAFAAAMAAACGEPKTEGAPAPLRALPVAAPEANEEAASAAVAAPAVPDEVRAKMPVSATPKVIISGEGEVASPSEGGDSHRRHAYDLPAGATGVVAVVTWDDPSWPDVEIAIGIGLCPHRGRELESTRSSAGAASIHHAVSADEALAEDRWFLHVNGDAGLAAKPGRALRYSYAVYAY